MSDRPRLKLTGVVLDSPDARKLADFYRRLLGREAVEDEPEWVVLTAPDGGAGLSFQTDQDYVPPAWPAGPDQQRMMAHLDIEVDDLDAAVAHALAEYQPQQHVRVCLDPAGHPFCLYLPRA
ncbi:VOC family protein [Actinoallomurus sp. NPDC052308]|uniref:VOC family protein n=1 Tax=Actinoallomurus sp. NPDC052308 TaxID=3155530 RepID=UPI00342AA487